MSQIFSGVQEALHHFRPLPRKVFPELEAARSQKGRVESIAREQGILQQTDELLEDREQIPQTSYTLSRLFRLTGERQTYERPYFLKRARLSAAALRLFLGQDALRETVQDYLWSVCEESSWVLPAHEGAPIDLFAAETGFLLAEVLLLLDELLDEEVRHRVRVEIEHRIFDPYLRFFQFHWWYRSASNWNGVCNSSIAETFLLLEAEPARVRKALEIALYGLEAFLETAFLEDGTSNEGVSYWHYGLFNFVALAESLYACSDGAINLFAAEKMQRIATFPVKMQFSGSQFANFADCDELVRLHPGIISRLARRVEEPALLSLLAPPAEPERDWRLPMLLRDLLWSETSYPASISLADARLPLGGIARLVGSTLQDVPVVLCLKAGHNAEEHNHNDVGSFIVHVGGENLLVDPGRGLYTRDYFREKRYENVFANSYSHNVPRIDGALQGSGQAFAGTLLEASAGKQIAIEFARAYACSELLHARRELSLLAEGNQAGTMRLRDTFRFAQAGHVVEEAFVTWRDCELTGAVARISGQHYDLLLQIEQPQELSFSLDVLEEQSRVNAKPVPLRRLSVSLPPDRDVEISVLMSVLEKTDLPTER